MPYIIIAIVVVVLALLAMLMLIARWLRRMAHRGTQAVQDRYAGRTIHHLDSGANFFGQQSLGVSQVRGNGTLALTDGELYFLRWAPQKEFIVPLRDIESVEIVKSFLGKSKFRPLLKINFRNAEGASDAMAWLVADAYNLKEQLEELIKGAPQRG